MQITLEVKSGIMIGRRFDVRPGSTCGFGKSEQATFFLPHDPHLADEHFSITCSAKEGVLKNLSPDGTFINGDKQDEAVLKTGDRITAGRTAFAVSCVEVGVRVPLPVITGQTVGGTVAAEEEEEAPPPPPKERFGAELLAWLSVDEEAHGLVEARDTAPQMVEKLALGGKYREALRVQAHCLEFRQAIWWGCLCLKEQFGEPMPASEAAEFQSALDWVADPTQENCRAAEKACDLAKSKAVSVWLGLAAFWTGESLGPVEHTKVPPDSRLPGQGVAGSLAVAGPHGDPLATNDRYRTFLAKAKEVAEGKHPFPEPAKSKA